MEIAETTFFTREITRILSDEEYKELQYFLVEHPKSGVVIKGSGGLRKIRWHVKNSGKSGGIRNIYYYHEDENLILMIYVYEKSKTSDLTQKQIEILKKTFLGDL
ncbi:MAG: type II toxin-antitoxin system RelE/ParE family toxin [Campylobacterales bacterium]|nr:type II toxin-antitoxin system RelE/ParE family toxin [Campylobacterales bacterium]